MAKIMNFGGIIYEWYKKNRRDLPWRRTSDPYLVWISEVILQQTRVSQGLKYYNNLVKVFPDVTSLAEAEEDRVLKLWQGLGYYSRARNMHRAAKDLVEKHRGKMPKTYDGLLEMKGVGTYTASAIASICFGEEIAVVDGNVARVIARLYGVEEAVNGTAGKRIIDSLAAELMAQSMGKSSGNKAGQYSDPGTHNQAMMEFGALHCVPVSPSCGKCPLAEGCIACQTSRVGNLPMKIPKRKPVNRYMYFYIIKSGGTIILTKRGTGGIWSSLYHFPMLESDQEHPKEEIADKLTTMVLSQLTSGVHESGGGLGGAALIHLEKISEPIRHQLSHLTIHARFIHLELTPLPLSLPAQYLYISLENLPEFPVPRLMERYMEVAKF